MNLVLLHGYGAHALDLYGLWPHLGLHSTWNAYFPQAPVTLMGSGPDAARAWFRLDEARLQRSFETGAPFALDAKTQESLEKAAEKAGRWIDALEIPSERLVLGGFSQGAMAALELLLQKGQKTAGLLVLSGAPARLEAWNKTGPALAGQSVYQCHGRRDPVLSFDDAELLQTRMKAWGWKGPWEPFNGGHEVPLSVVQSVQIYLNEVKTS